MTSTVKKGLILRGDQYLWDGITTSASRQDQSGGIVSGTKIGDSVDVLSVYGDERTNQVIQDAITSIGSGKNVTLSFAPGTWEIADDLTIGSNFANIVPSGCVFNVSSGKTLTFNGPVFNEHPTWSSGAGTVTTSGSWLLDTNLIPTGFFTDSGSANTYVITPSPALTAYKSGMRFVFKAANTNTGASTLNVNGLGAKSIVSRASGNIESGAIIANQIIDVMYDGTNFQIMNRVNTTQGAIGTDIASTAALPVGTTVGNIFDVTGTTTITSLTAKGVGSIVILHFDGALTLTHHATNLILPGGANITTAAGDEAILYEYGAGTWRCLNYQRAASTPSVNDLVTRTDNILCPHHNLAIDYATVSTFTITADALVLENTSTLDFRKVSSVSTTVNITASGADGLDTGAEAVSTWYHIWAIYNPSTGATDGLLSTSTTAPTLPSGYTYKGYVGAIYNNSSGNLVQINQLGNVVSSASTIVLTSGAATGATEISLATAVPTTAREARFRGDLTHSASINSVYFQIGPLSTGTALNIHGSYLATSAAHYASGYCPIVNAQSVYYLVDAGTTSVTISILGWRF